MFWAPCSSGGGGVDGWGWGVFGGAPHKCAHARACMHMHACTCMHLKHDNFMQMAPHWGNPWEFPMMSYVHVRVCACMHVHACACVTGAPSHQPPPHPPTHPPTPQGGTPGISQNSIALELIEIFQFCLKI